ncbi:ricin-type beta-trefoil lectin domain protein [Micromonospora sp. NPDC047548]|uniref:ricin-type beta-trefoil lectin domain protein n=1 Tax=Micromonospora sp. NPDC047548 TaxID=3155624 RepID=UPI0033CADB48
MAVGLVLALVAGMATYVPAAAAPPPTSDGTRHKSVPAGKLTPRKPLRTATDRAATTRITHRDLPRPDSASVPPTGAVTRVGDLPVTVSPAAPTKGEEARADRVAAPAPVRVRVLDQRATTAAGVRGALLSLSRQDPRPGRARVLVDYSGFRNAFGADYAGRLRLVELPACALTSPAKAACRAGRDLRAVNARGTLTADVMVAGSGGDSLVALTSSATSGGGNFESTSLRQAYSWSAGNIGGSFTYSHPLGVPPAPGPTPNLALTYDSGLVDGQTVADNGQASWVGEGWDLQIGYVERSYRPCSQDAAGSQLVGDLCWFSRDNATLVFGGQSVSLVKDATNGWRAAKDDGLKVEKLTDTVNDDNDHEYWKVTTQDGTQYFFGKNKRYSNDNESTNSVQTVAVYGDDPEDPCANTMCREGYRWNLDYVVDTRGNTMTYVYDRFTGYYQPGTGSLGSKYLYDVAANLDHIDYGDRAGSEHSANAPMRVTFEKTSRCIGSCTNADYPDTPLDLYCDENATACSSRGPVFFNKYKLSAINTQVWDSSSPAQYRTVDRWELNHTFPPNPDLVAPAGADTSPNLWLQSIRHIGYAKDGTSITEPLMEFGGDYNDPATGEVLGNRVDWGGSTGMPPYVHYRMVSVRPGTGSQTSVTYTRTPDRGVKCDSAWAPFPDNNPYLCFPQYHQPNDASQQTAFGWYYKYLVSSVTERDLTGSSPDEKTTYAYTNEATSDSALWAHDTNESVQLAYRTWSQWRGYSTVTATKDAGANAKTVSRNVFHRGMDDDGKTNSDGSGMTWFSRRAGLLAPLGTPNLDGAISGQGGKCLDIINASQVEGTSVHLWECYGGASQVWLRGPNGSIRNPASGMCLDIDNWQTANGTELQIWKCTGGWNQVWQPQPDGSLRNPQSGRCVDISSWGTVNGTRVQLWDCTGDYNQVWQPQADQSMVNPQANRCMEVANGASTDGTKLWSRKCTTDDPSANVWQPAVRQVWQLQTNGQVKNPATGKCMDIQGPNTANGTLVHLWTCSSTPVWSQIWQPQDDGSLKNPQSGRCLETATGTYGDASGQLKIADCNGTIGQKWINRFVDSDGLHGALR